MGKSRVNRKAVTIITAANSGTFINVKELIEYRDLLRFLIWRNIKVLYAQTILGFSWAILNPVIQIVIFTVVFGKIAKISTEGIPYALFSGVAIIPWTYMSQAMTQSSQSLVSGQNMLGKVYFPRIIFPLTPVLSRIIDFMISVSIVLALILYYRVHPTWNLMFFPIFVLMMVGIAVGVGMWTSAMAIRFRDMKYAMPFVIRMLMYSAPIVYSASSIPEKYRFIYSLNPVVGVIEGFRSCLLGTPMPWLYILPGLLTTLLLLISGMMYFKKMEDIFVDVI